MTERKLCPRCGDLKGIDQFRRVYKDRDDLRHGECRTCRNRRERRNRQQKRRHQLSKGLTQLRQEQDPTRLEVLAKDLIRSCGGLNRMLQLTFESFENPGQSGFRSQLLSTVLHVILKTEEQQKSERRDLPSLSDEELQRAFERRVEALIQEKPMIAVNALRRAGWSVERQ